LVDVVEAIVGTVFLSPVVFAAVIGCSQNPSVVISIAAVLALPVGWLILTFSRFVFTFRGRYEHFPTMKFMRGLVDITVDDKTKSYIINLGNALPPKKKENCSSIRLVLNETDFEALFDPFKSLAKSRILFWKSYRAKQEDEKEKIPYVENIEDMIFFEDQELADFIRSAAANYHTYLAAGWALLFGLLFSIGLTLSMNADAFNKIQPALQAITLVNSMGIAVCTGVVLFLIWATARQSRLRKNEAIAHEYLMIRLKLEKQNQSESVVEEERKDRIETEQTKSEPEKNRKLGRQS
jgi:hypothetical protein